MRRQKVAEETSLPPLAGFCTRACNDAYYQTILANRPKYGWAPGCRIDPKNLPKRGCIRCGSPSTEYTRTIFWNPDVAVGDKVWLSDPDDQPGGEIFVFKVTKCRWWDHREGRGPGYTLVLWSTRYRKTIFRDAESVRRV